VSLLEAVRAVEEELGEAGVPSPRVDAEYLVGDALGRTRVELYAGNGSLSPEQEDRLRGLVARRRRREPLAYILGEWGFRNLILAVDCRVLVPRPETEVLVERCLDAIRDLEAPRVVDVGTGSGAIALAIASEHHGARVLGIDTSLGALEVARENRVRAGLVDRVTLRRTDLLSGLAGPVDLVASNPPYVREDELDSVDPEVRDWEPRIAVVGEGIAERIADDARRVLRVGGTLVLECGAGQSADLASYLVDLGYGDVEITPDLAGRDRVVEGRVVRALG
jgi:release factor glutamine methyltransferase